MSSVKLFGCVRTAAFCGTPCVLRCAQANMPPANTKMLTSEADSLCMGVPGARYEPDEQCGACFGKAYTKAELWKRIPRCGRGIQTTSRSVSSTHSMRITEGRAPRAGRASGHGWPEPGTRAAR